MEDLQVVFDNTPGTYMGRASATTLEIGSDVTNVQILGLISNQFAGTWKCLDLAIAFGKGKESVHPCAQQSHEIGWLEDPEAVFT